MTGPDQDLRRARPSKIFYSSANAALSTNITDIDRRASPIRTFDEAGLAFTNIFDGLDRRKSWSGPVISYVAPPGAPAPPATPPSVQQAGTNYYDAGGVVLTNVNAIGEKSITWSDALHRPTR